MPTCAAIKCLNRQFRGCEKTFHRFPQNMHLKKKWIANTKRKKYTPSATAVLCSDHFEESAFDRTGQTTRLRKDAVPTIFQFPDHLNKKYKPRNPRPRKQTASSSGDNVHSQDSIPLPDVPGPSEPGPSHNDHSYCIKESPRYLKHQINQALDTIQALKKRLKFSQQKTRRLKKKVLSLSAVVKTLKDKNLIPTNCANLLEKTYSGVPLKRTRRILNNKERGSLTK